MIRKTTICVAAVLLGLPTVALLDRLFGPTRVDAGGPYIQSQAYTPAAHGATALALVPVGGAGYSTVEDYLKQIAENTAKIERHLATGRLGANGEVVNPVLFITKTCGGCHSPANAEANGNFAMLKEDGTLRELSDYERGKVRDAVEGRNGAKQMPLKGKLPAPEVKQVTDYYSAASPEKKK